MYTDSWASLVQLFPADGWWAQFDDDGQPVFSKLVAWALIEDDGSKSLLGLDGEGAYVTFACDMYNFMGYVYLPDGPQATKGQA